MKRYLFAFLALSACKWTDFDDLADSTWVHSQQKPSIGSSDYAVGLVGVSDGTAGGRLAVVSRDSPTYSTLEFDASGSTAVGTGTLKLAGQAITALAEQPILVSDGKGAVALVERSGDGGFIVAIGGAPTQPQNTNFASAAAPDAATFAGTTLVISTGTNLVMLDNASTAPGGVPARSCIANDAANMPITGMMAMAADDANLWVWAKSGDLYRFSLAALASTCTTLSPTPPAIAATANAFNTTGFVPGAGALLSLLGTSTSTTQFAVLAAHGDKATTGRAFIVDLRASMQVGATLMADGMFSSTLGVFGGKTYLVLGFPSLAVGTTTAAGQVALHEIDPATGALTVAPADLLNDAQPEDNQLFGRGVTTMQYNGNTILVVAASNEIFAYYKTLLYP